MLYPRIIPCLLIHRKGLYKTVNFKEPKYVGDPINAVRIFNEKEVDELMVLDIDATVEKREPDYRMIEHLAEECRMPLCYGGGIKTVEQSKRIFSLGVEKVALSSAIVEKPELIAEIASEVGRQSVVAVLDVRRNSMGKYDVYVENGLKLARSGLSSLLEDVQAFGIGEVVINSIDNDGCMMGYDLELVELVKSSVGVPLTVLGGLGSLGDVSRLVERYGTIGVAAGSFFVFKGKYRAVLISYPDSCSKLDLLKSAMAKNRSLMS